MTSTASRCLNRAKVCGCASHAPCYCHPSPGAYALYPPRIGRSDQRHASHSLVWPAGKMVHRAHWRVTRAMHSLAVWLIYAWSGGTEETAVPLACDLHPEFGYVGSAPRLLRKLGRLKNSHAHSISIDQRKIILLVFEFSGFSHSLGQNPNPSSTPPIPLPPAADMPTALAWSACAITGNSGVSLRHIPLTAMRHFG
jgi:hypothetical protein